VPRPYPYYPSWDGKKASELILQVADLMQRRYKGTKNLGTYANRKMRGSDNLSVHATGYALDLSFTSQKQAEEIWNYLLGTAVVDGKEIQLSAYLGICEIHWYNKPKTTHGAAFRCSRGEGHKGVKLWTSTDNGGSGGNWLHLEVDHTMTPDEWEKRFRATKPVKDA
jgi:hypothetical protein